MPIISPSFIRLFGETLYSDTSLFVGTYFHCAIDYNVGCPLEANIGNLQYNAMFFHVKIIIMKFYLYGNNKHLLYCSVYVLFSSQF